MTSDEIHIHLAPTTRLSITAEDVSDSDGVLVRLTTRQEGVGAVTVTTHPADLMAAIHEAMHAVDEVMASNPAMCVEEIF